MLVCLRDWCAQTIDTEIDVADQLLTSPVTVYWPRASQSQRWPYNAMRLAGWRKRKTGGVTNGENESGSAADTTTSPASLSDLPNINSTLQCYQCHDSMLFPFCHAAENSFIKCFRMKNALGFAHSSRRYVLVGCSRQASGSIFE